MSPHASIDAHAKPGRGPAKVLLAGLGLIFRLACALVIILDELVRPLYRPLIDRLAALAPMRALERWIGARTPLVVLTLLIIPYAIVEPLKFVGLLWIADGHVRTGGTVFVLAHLVSFILIERIFTAGKPQLMTIGWMRWVIETASAVRDAVVARLRLHIFKRRLLALLRHLRFRLRRMRPTRNSDQTQV
ncbi:hypothetical protein ACO2RV_13810 [Ancylobacter sp. VNQ12]|uniref:hypothetical protein n=1 Tax=Ancylobacter sp. VNQ12 TaxID=3400920 RepID=UPI003BFB5C3B